MAHAALILLAFAVSLALPAYGQRERDDEPGATRATASVASDAASGSAPAGATTTDPEDRVLAPYGEPRRAKTAEEDPLGMAGAVAVRLGLVLALIVACAFAWRRLQGALPRPVVAATEGVQVLSTVGLAPQRFVHLVSVGGQRLLLGSSPQQVSVLAYLDDEGRIARGSALPAPSEGRQPAITSGDRRPPLPAAGSRAGTASEASGRGAVGEGDEEQFGELVAWVQAIDAREELFGETDDAPPVRPAARPRADEGRPWLASSERLARPEAVPPGREPASAATAPAESATKSIFRTRPPRDG